MRRMMARPSVAFSHAMGLLKRFVWCRGWERERGEGEREENIELRLIINLVCNV